MWPFGLFGWPSIDLTAVSFDEFLLHLKDLSNALKEYEEKLDDFLKDPLGDLPTANIERLGLVKGGGNVEINGNGEMNVPAATADSEGVVKPGANMSVVNGAMAVDVAAPGKFGVILLQDKSVAPVYVDDGGHLYARVATETQTGVVKIGEGLNIQADGTLTVTSAMTTWDNIEGKPSSFPPPVATDTVLGGVKAGGTGIIISPDGTISATGEASVDTVEWGVIKNVPEASDTQKGIMKAGDGLTADAGVVKVSDTLTDRIDSIDQNATEAIRIAGDADLKAQAVQHAVDAFTIPAATAQEIGGVKSGGDITVDGAGNVTVEHSSSADSAGTANNVNWGSVAGKPSSYPPPVATTAVLGGLKAGPDISIANDGTPTVNSAKTISTTLGVEKGGTGATTAAAARSALGITPANIGAQPSLANPPVFRMGGEYMTSHTVYVGWGQYGGVGSSRLLAQVDSVPQGPIALMKDSVVTGSLSGTTLTLTIHDING